MTPEEVAQANAMLAEKSPLEITRWALEQAAGQAVVTTNFRPYEAVILHLCTRVQADIPVVWVDHGYNRPATYRHKEALSTLLKLNVKSYLPRQSAAHRDAIDGPLPAADDEAGLRKLSAAFKLEPFNRAIAELSPRVWLTAVRKSQGGDRENMSIVALDSNFGTLKVSPVFGMDDRDMEAYLAEHELPNEWDYFDPTKADEKRECGLHAAWGAEATSQ